MKPKQYPKYKDSEIQWIGKIPEEWDNCKLKHVINEFVSGGTPRSDDEKFWTHGEHGIPWVNISDMTYNELITETKKEITVEGQANKGLRILKKRTLLYSIFASLGKVAVLGIDATTNQAILGLIISKKIDATFLKYYLKNLEKTIITLSNANTQNNLNSTIVKNIEIAIPLSPDQISIANFLDKKTIKIDILIEKDKKLIELLKEKRIALINHAVTKGLDLNVKMKDSGIKWIDEIQEVWEVHKLKYKTIINKKKLDDCINPNYVINYLDISNVDSSGNILNVEEQIFEDAPSRARRIPRSGDTILSTVRTYLKAIAYLENISSNLIVSTGFAVLEPIKSINSKYLFYSTSSEVFIQSVIAYSKGVAYPAINPTELGQIVIIIPPLSEQTTIVNFLDKTTEKIDKTIHKILKKIELLEEYKKSLIHHTVTGKIDVREAI